MLSIYVWGNGSKVASFHPQSVAIASYVSSHCPDVIVIPNSNISLSTTGELPFLLLEDNTQIHGYSSIVSHLNHTKAQSPDQSLLNDGFLEYMSECCEVITSYNLFLNKDNYVSYTRPLFKSLLPFPLQYKPPIDMRASATRICQESGITADDSAKDDNSEDIERIRAQEEKLKEMPVINDLQKSQVDKSLADLAMKKGILTNMKCLDLLQEVIDTYKSLDLPSDSSSVILFFSYLQVNTLSEMESSFVSDYLIQHDPKLLEQVKLFSLASGPKIKQSQLKLSDALYNTLQSYI